MLLVVCPKWIAETLTNFLPNASMSLFRKSYCALTNRVVVVVSF